MTSQEDIHIEAMENRLGCLPSGAAVVVVIILIVLVIVEVSAGVICFLEYVY